MKTTSADKIKLVKRLAAVIDSRKEFEKEEKDLKAAIKDFMEDELILEAGSYCVTISPRTRKDLDKDALTKDMGQEFIVKYSKLSSYDVLEVKSLKRAS